MTRRRCALQRIGTLLETAFRLPQPALLEWTELNQLDAIPIKRTPSAPAEHTFMADLIAVRSELLAQALTLTRDRDAAADLVQDTCLKAIRSRHLFQTGTNLKAWTYRIMKNHFLSARRRDKFSAEWDDCFADRYLVSAPTQEHAVEMTDLDRAIAALPGLNAKRSDTSPSLAAAMKKRRRNAPSLSARSRAECHAREGRSARCSTVGFQCRHEQPRGCPWQRPGRDRRPNPLAPRAARARKHGWRISAPNSVR